MNFRINYISSHFNQFYAYLLYHGPFLQGLAITTSRGAILLTSFQADNFIYCDAILTIIAPRGNFYRFGEDAAQFE